MSTVDITPSPRVLRMLGQIDFAPWQCLAELIDNSVDAFIDQGHDGTLSASPRIKILLPTDSELKSGEGIIQVIDNGRGMTIDQLEDSVKAGYSGNDPVEKMGLFGMGFNISTARLGRRTEVWTTTSDSPEWTGIVIDFDELEQNQTFHAPLAKRNKTEAELESGAHGTSIQISRLEADRTRPLIWGAGKARTKTRLGKIYGRVMQNLGIRLIYDGDAIEAWKHCVWDEKRSVKTKEFGNVSTKIYIDEKLSARKFCTTCWVWQSDHETSCPACGETENIIERNRRVTGWIGVQRYFDKNHFGFDLVRNGRVIESLNKSFFTYHDPNGEEVFEYPRDAIHWGGRLVGELEIDFVRVSHQKDAFDKLDPEWAQVVRIVRGESPLQPQIAKRMGLPHNTSPLAKLYTGYRKGDAGLKSLVPGKSDGGGLNTGIVLEYVDKFYSGEADYQSDEKLFELVLRVESAKRGGSSGADDAAGEFPIDGEEPGYGGATGDPGVVGGVTEPSPPFMEKDVELSQTYELDNLPGKPKIKVEANMLSVPIAGKAFEIEPAGAVLRFNYCPKDTFFEESLETPADCLVTEMSHHFLALSSETIKNWPISILSRRIKSKYFPESITDVNLAALPTRPH